MRDHREVEASAAGNGLRLRLLFTTFPLLTETFLQRELRAILAEGVKPEVWSIWKGGGTFEGVEVARFRLVDLWKLVIELPYWLLRKPGELTGLLKSFRFGGPANFQNFQENALGLAFGIIQARKNARSGLQWTHAAWATMPATAALVIHRLTGQPFSMGAHAYDIFQGGGDWVLKEKVKAAAFIHTSTVGGRAHLTRLGTDPGKILLLRRGLLPMPAWKPWRPPTDGLCIVTIGRLVKKKNLGLFLEVIADLRGRGIRVVARVIGDGPERKSLAAKARELGLEADEIFLGSQTSEETQQWLAEADCFCFTGKPAPDGDRDGLPNVIPEAMALGVPVVASSQPGVGEAITDGYTGTIVDSEEAGRWSEAILRLFQNPDLAARMTAQARAWVEENFDAREQVRILLARMKEQAAVFTA